MGARLTKALANAPGVAVSTVLTATLTSVLPNPLPWVAFLGALSMTGGLLTGAGERVAIRVLDGGRPLTQAERAALAPVVVLLCQRGLGPPLVRLWLWPGALTVSARGAGRRSVLVSAGLVTQVRLGRLPADQAAAVIGHAAGLVRVGAVRSDLALALWTVPWRFLRGIRLGVADTCGRLPLVRLMWRARFVVGLIALCQGVTAGRPEAVAAGVLSAAVVVLSYLIQGGQRRWSARLQAIGDEQVAYAGLAPALADFLLRQTESAATFERVHQLKLAHDSVQPASPPVRSAMR